MSKKNRINTIIPLLLIGCCIAVGFIFFGKKKKPHIIQKTVVIDSPYTNNATLTMPINEPREEPGSIPYGPKTISIISGANGDLFYYQGDINAVNQPISTDLKKLRLLIREKKKDINLAELLFLTKFSEASSFKDFVDLFDLFTLENITKGHYRRQELNEADSNFLSRLHDSNS